MVRAAKLIPLGSPNLDDDEQVDLSAHGGADKAVYGYPSEHYDDWQSELPDTTLTPGNFGESSTESFTRKLA
ncbi:MOSC domain-containing protein [Leptolyngbya sp. ST-U4]|uniref:MOSC domain-containing protein n=1 Tax=Leptolyngbya sp. ST-U4 TaxID=2933912 RepID=UPI003297A37D